MVAEHEDLVPELLLGGAGALHQVRVGRRGQVAGAFDAALAPRVGLAAEQQQGEGCRLDIQGLGGGHDTHPFFSANSANKPFRLIDVIYHNRPTSD
ncbi:hypothetical protein ASD26_13125 [Streptomyces sp. Root1319]|nr:hypothetical protein ASD26_13125 [Streptomyces sp. Root1319]